MSPKRRTHPAMQVACIALLLGSFLAGASALAAGEAASPRPAPEVPADMVGAWCPTGGCETRSAGPWDAAGFALSLGAVVLLSRRRR